MYTQQRYVLMTLDPVHVGTGGYRLGRVDLSIVREPGSNLPKIPGTSLSGAARAYAAMHYKTPQCAGQGQGKEDGEKGHCRDPKCPVCYTFGYMAGADGGHAGTVSIADAQLLLFPVYSLAGPVWVSTAGRMQAAGFDVTSPSLERGKFATTLVGWNKPLNLGWLLLQPVADARATVSPPPKFESLASDPAWQVVKERLVIVDDGLFSQIVNSNLEVRTSVSIDPLTGAAKKGMLYTYEAIPRAAWLWCDVVEDDYRKDKLPDVRPLDVVKDGLRLTEYLGVGGMGTRGFGRVKLMGDWEVSRE